MVPGGVASRRWVLPFAATLLAMFALQLSNLAFPPLVPSIQRDFGMTYAQAGSFIGMYGLLALLLSVPAGLSAKRFGEKRVLVLGLIGVAAGNVLLGKAWDVWSAFAFRGLTISTYRFAFVSVLIAIALTAPASLRGRTMGLLGATSALASVIGSPLGGLLVREFTWRTAILGYAAMAAIGAVVFWAVYHATSHGDAERSDGHATTIAMGTRAFTSPVVWILALIVGLGGFGQFTVTQFVPSVSESIYRLDAAAAGVIISTGYLTAIVVNLGVGALADRYNKLVVLGAMFAMLALASATLSVEKLMVFRISTAAVIGLGFTAANQIYGLAASVMPRAEAAHAMGVVSLGAGLFGYLGPYMVGMLRDRTGSFAAGFYMVAIADVLTLGLIVLLYRVTRHRAV